VHVSEILPVGGAVVFMREEGKLRGGLDLSLPGRRVGYGLIGAAAVKGMWLVAGNGTTVIGQEAGELMRHYEPFARATLRCHSPLKKERGGISGKAKRGYRLLLCSSC
jgi:hypothetical protein